MLSCIIASSVIFGVCSLIVVVKINSRLRSQERA